MKKKEKKFPRHRANTKRGGKNNPGVLSRDRGCGGNTSDIEGTDLYSGRCPRGTFQRSKGLRFFFYFFILPLLTLLCVYLLCPAPALCPRSPAGLYLTGIIKINRAISFTASNPSTHVFEMVISMRILDRAQGVAPWYLFKLPRGGEEL